MVGTGLYAHGSRLELEAGPDAPHRAQESIRDGAGLRRRGRRSKSKDRGEMRQRARSGCSRLKTLVALLMETTTHSSLPPEVLDLTIDHLRCEPTTLKACCLVSKAWVPRARKHLFARVEFRALQRPVELWKKAFPDPSNSPAHHTRTLCIRDLPTLTAADTDLGGWIRTFHNIVHLRLERIIWQGRGAPLVPFYGLAPTIRSLRLTSTSFEVFDLICSFPLLEDLALILLTTGDADGWTAPSTSPRLTGSLELIMNTGGTRSVVRRLLDFPDGLHFTEISVSCIGEEDARSATDLVSRCSDTLETLAICGIPVGGSPSASVIGQHLISRSRRRHASRATSP